MPLYIKDDETADMVAELARRLKTSKQDAVKTAVGAKLATLEGGRSFEQKLADFYARNPLPERTGEVADKAFFDELSGEVE